MPLLPGDQIFAYYVWMVDLASFVELFLDIFKGRKLRYAESVIPLLNFLSRRFGSRVPG